MAYFKRKMTFIEILLVFTILVLIAAILLPPAKWASSGEIRVPVKIIVFDALNHRPLPKGECQVFRSSPMLDSSTSDEDYPSNKLAVEFRGATDEAGISVIEYEFRTGASDKRPRPHAHLSFAWVQVQVAGYGGVVVPVRYGGQPTSQLREAGEIVVTIGLMPVK